MTANRSTRRTLAGVGLVAVAGLASVLAAPEVPARMTTHWNAAGVPDDSTPATWVLVGGPAFVGSIVLLFEVIPRIDPLADNIAAFRDAYDLLAVLVAGFLTYVYGFVLAWNLGYEFPVEQVLAPAIGALFVAVGFLLTRAERNWFVGIRTPWTLSSETVWRKTHDRAAVLFVLAGVVAFAGVLLPEYFVYLVAGPVAAIALYATAYSFVAYRRLDGGDVADERPE